MAVLGGVLGWVGYLCGVGARGQRGVKLQLLQLSVIYSFVHFSDRVESSSFNCEFSCSLLLQLQF